MFFYAERYPNKTQGVVTFNTGQQYRIEANRSCIKRKTWPAAYFYNETWRPSNGYFIKNIESVQGDERDFIIFSVGTQRREWEISMNFGPKQEGGYRRLNVAITRARIRIDIFSSITHQIYCELKSRGIKALGHISSSLTWMKAADPKGDDTEKRKTIWRRCSSWNQGADRCRSTKRFAGYRIDSRTPPRTRSEYLGRWMWWCNIPLSRTAGSWSPSSRSPWGFGLDNTESGARNGLTAKKYKTNESCNS